MNQQDLDLQKSLDRLTVKEIYQCKDCDAIYKGGKKQGDRCSGCGKYNLFLIGTLMPELTESDIINGQILFNETYQEIINFMKGYVDLPDDYYKFISLWIMGTYFHSQFNTYPFLFLNAMRGSGKTRLLKIISHLQKNGTGDVQNNISEAVLFRTAKERGLIIDEFESIGGKEKSILRELLNAAYKKGGKVRRMKKVSRQGEEKQVVEEFDLFTPIAMANISGIEEVLSDRCITIILEKSSNLAMTKKIEDFDNHPSIESIKVRLTTIGCSLCSVVSDKKYVERWNNYISNRYNNYINTLHTYHTPIYTNIHQEINYDELFNKIDSAEIDGRNLELLFPLIITAKFLEEKEFEEILRISKDIVKSKKSEEFTESKDVSVIDFISKQTLYRYEKISVKSLTRLFREFLALEDDEDGWVNYHWLGRALKRLGLLKEKIRTKKGMEVLVDTEKAKEKLKIFRSNENA